ncbi:MAG: dNTP triphosphohydrolase [Campylobacterales bacterium]
MKPEDRFHPFEADFRNPWRRDRDRIIHSSAFRRLEYKTQVFINSEGDYYRTRLTHSLEASQIARTISSELGLNEALAEAIALAHDLGHTPFGHVGGEALDELLKEHGSAHGFEHNFQSFRVVTALEHRYPNFPGLNLTYATLEGLIKHSFPYRKSFLPEAITTQFQLDYHPSLEAMIVDKADEIAYISADIDDGIQCGLISFSDLADNPLVDAILARVRSEGIDQASEIFRLRFTTHLISTLITDLIDTTRRELATLDLPTQPACALLEATTPVPVRFSPSLATALKQLKKELFHKLYRHETILRRMHFGRVCIRGIFKACFEDEGILPATYRQQLEHRNKNRVIADFIASLTDRSAEKLYRELY